MNSQPQSSQNIENVVILKNNHSRGKIHGRIAAKLSRLVFIFHILSYFNAFHAKHGILIHPYLAQFIATDPSKSMNFVFYDEIGRIPMN